MCISDDMLAASLYFTYVLTSMYVLTSDVKYCCTLELVDDACGYGTTMPIVHVIGKPFSLVNVLIQRFSKHFIAILFQDFSAQQYPQVAKFIKVLS